MKPEIETPPSPAVPFQPLPVHRHEAQLGGTEERGWHQEEKDQEEDNN